MKIHTIEDDFEYQYLEILGKMKEEFKELDSDILWDNRERLGELFFEAINDYADIEVVLEKLN